MLSRITNGILKVAALAADRPLPAQTDEERRLIEVLRDDLRALPVMPVTGVPDSEANWNRNLNELRDLVLNDDPRNFLRWPMVQRAMFVTYPPYVMNEFAYLRAQPDWASRWRDAIRESPVGHPLRLGFYPASSGNLTHHAYHLARFESLSGQRVEDLDVVFEFGGGYGGMARLVHNLGFRGRYVTFDLPHFSALQRFFLARLGIPLRTAAEFADGLSGVACVSDLEALRAVLASVRSDARSLFLATWSISETPEHIRASVLPLVSHFSHFCVAYQHRFEEVDNVAYFKRWRETAGDVAWRDERIPHLPHDSYLVGRRR